MLKKWPEPIWHKNCCFNNEVVNKMDQFWEGSSGGSGVGPGETLQETDRIGPVRSRKQRQFANVGTLQKSPNLLRCTDELR